MLKPKYIIAGNWKLNKGPAEAKTFCETLSDRLKGISLTNVKVVVAPPFVSLTGIKPDGFSLCAQDVFWEDNGAFTGEVSASMLKEIGVEYCIIGHSERRQFFHEIDRTVNLKAIALLKNRIKPIICIGERFEERKTGLMYNVVKFQLASALFDIQIKDPDDIVIAYEPVWAIGTGNVATPQQAEDMHEVIRKSLEKQFGVEIGSKIRILYGGSVSPDNIAGLVEKEQINGALIGGASLDLDKFISIIKYVSKKES
ncbi:MAG: triose-phosphate isomerase [bacterium]